MYLNKNDFQIAKEKFNDCGYIIFEELLSNEDVSKYVSALQPYLIKIFKVEITLRAIKLIVFMGF